MRSVVEGAARRQPLCALEPPTPATLGSSTNGGGFGRDRLRARLSLMARRMRRKASETRLIVVVATAGVLLLGFLVFVSA